MIDGIDHRREFPGALAVAHRGEGHRRPHGRVRVLRAVLTHAPQVTLDVAGTGIRSIERRIQQLHQRGIPLDELPVHRVHRRAHPLRVAGRRQHGPTLRNRIDPALDIRRCAERRAVVEPGAAVPGAVPGAQFDVVAQIGGLALAACGEIDIVAQARQLLELRQDRIEEEAEPHAFALAACADQVHSVVPVACSHQRQTVDAEAQRALDRPNAVSVEIRHRY